MVLLLLAAIAILGMLVVWYATPFGVGTSPDSVAYIGVAQNLHTGQGLTVPLGDRVNQPLTQFPPFYPLVLAAFTLVNAPAYSAARLLTDLLFAANILMVGWMLYRLAPHAGWAAVLASLGMLVAPAMLEIHVMAWSEPLFILLGFSGLFVLADHLEKPQRGRLAGAALLCGLAILTRYAGVVFLAAGLLGIVLFAQADSRRKVSSALLFTLIGALPLIANLAYNQLATGSATNRGLAFHPITRSQLWQGLTTISGWIGLPANLPTWLHLLVLVAAAILVGWIFIIVIRRREKPAARLPAFIQVLLLFVLLYGGFLLLSISFVDANTPLDNRILSPMFVGLLILVVYAAAQLSIQGNNVLRWSLSIIVGLLLINWVRLSLPNLQQFHHQGIGFSTPEWQTSPLIADLKLLPGDTRVYSNAPDAVYLLAGRPAVRLPRPFELSSQQENAAFAEEMQTIGAELASGEALIVFFTTQGRRTNPSQEDLIAYLDLQVQDQFDDGIVYTLEKTTP